MPGSYLPRLADKHPVHPVVNPMWFTMSRIAQERRLERVFAVKVSRSISSSLRSTCRIPHRGHWYFLPAPLSLTAAKSKRNRTVDSHHALITTKQLIQHSNSDDMIQLHSRVGMLRTALHEVADGQALATRRTNVKRQPTNWYGTTKKCEFRLKKQNWIEGIFLHLSPLQFVVKALLNANPKYWVQRLEWFRQDFVKFWKKLYLNATSPLNWAYIQIFIMCSNFQSIP